MMVSFKNMEPFQDRPILGATLDPEPQEDQGRELPMVVWLRGDEEHCAEFTLDADDVMTALGIKRSRLTQIAGKDLRVGRMRRGRYVSPVFRPVDVEQYASWTRATASHVKSSTLLNDAAAELQRQGASLADGVRENLQRHTSEILKSTTGEFSDLRRAIPDSGPRLERLESQVRQGFAAQKAMLEQLTESLRQQGTVLQLAMQSLAEITALWRTTRDDLKALGAPKIPARLKRRKFSPKSKPAPLLTAADTPPNDQIPGSDASRPPHKSHRERHAAPPAPRRRRASTARL